MSKVEDVLEHSPLSLPNEEWRDVVGWEGLYQVSNLGRVAGLRERRDISRRRILKPVLKNAGYWQVSLQLGPEKKGCTIHRLVACAFLGSPEDRRQVNHKDGDKQNNALENLEWVTCSENMSHAAALGLVNYAVGVRNPQHKLTEDQVREIRSLRGVLSQRTLGARFGVSNTTIRRIQHGQMWKSLE
jgi:hypothetical protein